METERNIFETFIEALIAAGCDICTFRFTANLSLREHQTMNPSE